MLFLCAYTQQKIPKANVLGTKLAGQTQRFYFDSKSGVILPGDTLNFPFVFKSPSAGIFTEPWELMTKPTLCGGDPIRITLRGEISTDHTQASETPTLWYSTWNLTKVPFSGGASPLAHYREYPPSLPWGVDQHSAAENVTYNTDLFFNAMFLAEIRNIQECGCYTESSILNLQRDIWMPYKTLFIKLLKWWSVLEDMPSITWQNSLL